VSAPELALPRAAGAARAARLARDREATGAFWGLIAFTVVLFVAPQNMVESLQVLAPGKLAAAVALGAYLLNRARTGQPLTITPPTVRWALVLAALALVSVPTSFWPGGSVAVFLDLLGKSLVIFLLIGNVVRTEDRVRTLISLMIFAGVLTAVVAVINFGTGRLESRGLRVAGYESPLALNPNDLALTLNILLGLAIGLYGVLMKLGNRILLGGIALMIAGVVVSFSRSGFLTFAVLIAFWAGRRLRQRGAGVLVLLVPLALLALMLLPAGYGERLATITDTAADPTGSASERLETMRAAARLAMEYPITGVGLGNNVHVNVARGGVHQDAHNAYLKVAAELGVAALVVYVGFIVAAYRAARHAERRFALRPETRALASLAYGVQLAIVAFAFGALFSPVPYHFYFYYPAGLAVALAAMARARPAGTPAGPGAR
jgi:O-antigen ligase